MRKGKEARSAAAVQKAWTDELKDRDRTLALFYADWCPFSRRFLPHFEAYAEAHPGECRIVEAEADPDACDAFDIDVYPSVLEFRNGRLEKRLDGIPGFGLSRQQLEEFCSKAP